MRSGIEYPIHCRVFKKFERNDFMKQCSFKLAALTASILLTACAQQPVVQSAQPVVTPTLVAAGQNVAIDQPDIQEELFLTDVTPEDFKVEDAQWLTLPQWSQAEILQTSKTQGLRIVDAEQRILLQKSGQFGRFDYRVGHGQMLLAVMDLQRQQPMLTSLNLNTRQWTASNYIPKRNFKADDICLYQDESQNAFAFLVGEEGIGEQWLVAQQQQPLAQPKLVRRLSFPPQSSFCKVNDTTAQLFINEENVGVWAYPAHSEADLIREAVDLVKPFGSIQGSPAGIALIDQQLAVIDEKKSMIYRYQAEKGGWKALSPLLLKGITEAERLSVKGSLTEKNILITDDNKIKRTDAEWQTQKVTAAQQIPVILPDVATDGVHSVGDAADDPAIWYNHKNPAQSRVLGTDKQGGLQVYDLKGKTVQYLAIGRINNVDVRHGFQWGGEKVDVAIASNRDHNSLHVFAIQPKTGVVSELGQLPTDLKDIYGICLYQDKQGEIYAIPNDKDGTFIQYHVHGKNKTLSATEIQRFAVASQPEGCVVDDQTGRIFLGEEDQAVWVMNLDPAQQSTLQQVIAVGDIVKDDIEGLGFYRGANQSYLVISSQGNDSYVVIDADAPYQVRGAFRIGINLDKSIDAVSETDGLEVSSHNFGGIWRQGMLVVQDGRKRMPEGNQNFKYVAWEKIAKLLKLD